EEDGIRDATVTGVQTCALPICQGGGEDGGTIRRVSPETGSPAQAKSWRTRAVANSSASHAVPRKRSRSSSTRSPKALSQYWRSRSEERRVGRECRADLPA